MKNKGKVPEMQCVKMLAMLLVLSGCNVDSNDEGQGQIEAEGSAIWRQDSERIVIIQDNGNVVNGDERYVTYDYSRDALTVEAKKILPTIHPTIENLTCNEDGSTYEITITNGSGLKTKYHSSNNACNNIEGRVFVGTEEITLLIPQLFTY